jgi:hypothetical protein
MSAERKLQPQDEATGGDAPLEPFALKQQVAERLAAHRSRKGRQGDAAMEQPAATPTRERTARIAAAVTAPFWQRRPSAPFIRQRLPRRLPREMRRPSQRRSTSCWKSWISMLLNRRVRRRWFSLPRLRPPRRALTGPLGSSRLRPPSST